MDTVVNILFFVAAIGVAVFIGKKFIEMKKKGSGSNDEGNGGGTPTNPEPEDQNPIK